jgi:hypothetical protein
MTEIEIEMYSVATWKKLKTGPLDDYEQLSKNESGKVIIKAHKDFIRCLIANDFDPRRATKIFANGKGTFDDLTPEGKEFRSKLAEMLKEMVRGKNRR